MIWTLFLGVLNSYFNGSISPLYACVCVCICLYIIHIQSTYICTYMCIHIYIYIHTHTHVCMYTYVFIYVYICCPAAPMLQASRRHPPGQCRMRPCMGAQLFGLLFRDGAIEAHVVICFAHPAIPAFGSMTNSEFHICKTRLPLPFFRAQRPEPIFVS